MVSHNDAEQSRCRTSDETPTERVETTASEEFAPDRTRAITGRSGSKGVDRRRFLQATTGTAAVFAGIPGTAAGWRSQASYSTSDRTISSFDGTDLATTLYTPDAGGPNPAILMTHGWGENRRLASMTASIAAGYAENGYVVLAYDSRGAYGSDGISAVNGPNEVADARHLIDWLAGRSDVETDGQNDPKLGMDGISYAAGLQPLVAVADDRVNAIVPRIGWYDLTYSFVPNGVVKDSWLTFLLAAGVFQTLDFDPGTRVADRIFEWYHDAIDTNRLPTDAEEGLEQRSLASHIDRFDTPTLLIQGWDDTLFNPNEYLRAFHELQARDVESAIVFYEGGHAIEEILVSPDDRAYLNDLAVTWMDKHLRGESTDVPTVSTYLKQRDEWRTGSQFPPADVSMTAYSLENATERGNPHIERWSWFHDTEVTYEWHVGRDIEVVGTPEFDLAVDVAGPEARLFFDIRHDGSDLDAIGKSVGEAARVDGPGRQRVQFEFPVFQRFFSAGDTLSLRISTESLLFEESTHTDGVTVLPSQSEIRLPQRPQ
ncbi:CocE/NonD family hydrolase [Natrinema caseinilyticum]|uniref:CocE/NonD family hydrolase n=1 Tax=Natrinema caseinilyticum TaxID=2961570 RepID=UPI0020C33B1B|nr:CocE/NonD family hydrolase [Natrinema caseinilyticum]